MGLVSVVISVKLLDLGTRNLTDIIYKIRCGNKGSVLNGKP